METVEFKKSTRIVGSAWARDRSRHTSASRELTRHGYRRGYAGWLLTIDTALALDFISVHGPDALLLALDRWSGPRVSVASAGRLRLGPRLISPHLA